MQVWICLSGLCFCLQSFIQSTSYLVAVLLGTKCSANIEVVQQSSSSILAKNGSPLAKFPFFWQLSAPLCLGARTHVSGCLSAARQTMEKTYHLLDSCSVWCPGNPHNTSPNPETHHLSNQTHIPEKLSPFMLYKESLPEAITPESSQRTKVLQTWLFSPIPLRAFLSLSGKTLHIFFAVNIQVKLINCFMLYVFFCGHCIYH